MWGGFAEGKNNLFADPLLTEIGTAHRKSVAQIVLLWLIRRGVVTIPKSVRRERMERNLDVFDFALPTTTWPGLQLWIPERRTSSTTEIPRW